VDFDDPTMLTGSAAATTTPPYPFEEFERRALQLRAEPRRTRLAAPAAACAGAALALAAAVLGPLDHGRRDSRQHAARAVAPEERQVHTAADQRWLNLLPGEPTVVRIGTRAAVADLEDRIASFDDALSESQARGDTLLRIQRLHSERARLVDSLVRVRYAEQLVAATD
jgi:hypothetical protein